MAGPPPSYSAIVAHTSSFLAELIADPLLRRHLLSAAAAAATTGADGNHQHQHPAATLQALSLVSDALDAAAASASPSPSSLRAAERLLRSSVTPSPTPLSCLLLALACAARRRGAAAAATAVMELFALDPALARHEVAPAAFEALFAPRLLPVMRHFAARRAAVAAAAAAAAASSNGGDEEDRSVETAAMSAMRVLSTMSGAQAQEMRELEREYDKVLDVNCRAYAIYLNAIIEAGGDTTTAASSPPPPPPELVFGVGDGEDNNEDAMEETAEDETPIWAEAEDLYPRGLRGSTSFKGRRDLLRPPSLYPQRVAPHLILQQRHQSPPTSRGSPASSRLRESSPAAPSDDSLTMDDSSSEICDGSKEENVAAASPLSKPSTHGDEGHLSPEPASSSSPMAAAAVEETTPVLVSTPKDFVCPITSQVFEDPVTLETGQTYERRAIQEWLDRGNATCPITRQRLRHAGQLPNTNYVLKRLIAAWRESPPLSSPSSRRESPPPVSAPTSPAPPPPPRTTTTTRIITMESNNKLRSSPSPDAASSHASAPSPTSVIALASVEAAAAELRAAVSCLCTSDDLAASEAAVLNIHRLWRDSSSPAFLAATLARPAVVNGFVEILFNSVTAQVLQTCVFLLAELASRDGAVVHTLTRVDSDVDCLVALFKKGLMEAVSLIYLLAPTPEQLADMDMADALVAAVRRHGEPDDNTGTHVVKMCVDPKAASVMLLSQLILFETAGDTEEDDSSSSAAAPVVPRAALLSDRFVRGVVASLDADTVEEKLAAVRILLRCVAEDGHCRTSIVDKCSSSSSLGALLDAFHAVGDADKFDIVRFLHEILKLKKRSAAQRVLRTIKDGGATFSTMHALLVYLQSTPPEQSPIVAGLLLQLDLLVEPRKISMYREEAMDSLIQCLKNTDFPRSQLLAAETIMCLPGKFSSSGRPLTRSSLLKLARVKERHRQSQDLTSSTLRGDADHEMDEAKAVSEWERKTAYALVSHEFGLVFEALSECLKTNNADLFTTSLVCATWLVYMLSLLPDTGVLGAARVCLLRQLVVVLRSAKHGSDRVLAMVALRSFMNDREGMHDITTYIKDVLKTLRDLKKSSGLAFEMLKLLSDGQESSVDMWNHKEINLVDCSSNGEVTSVVYFKSFIFSGHSDGTLKVWEGSENILRLVHESQEHAKAITSLAVRHSEEKIFSGSLDKTIRVWQFRDSLLQCVEVHDTRDPVQNLVVANAMACFVPQGAGVKLLTWNGNSKLLNPNKYVRSMALLHGKLFCGCSDSSIQEIDLASGTLGVIQSGNKRILGKANPIYSLQVHEGLLYTGSTSLDGASVKVWNSSNYNLVGSIPSSMEARSLVVSADLIYLGSRNGVVEIWSREKLTRIGTLQAGGPSCRVQCMAVDGDGDVLVVGTSDGRIQAWGLT
ncbi:hypothetical protein PR202_ga24268 [Eleusine coracana subsp. coracana]|uniref:RING-type E3 ubiquitin transferase n=1 Tax=Eleusine coracana subsp. coracana TaxID=191504 RepID=A0AAV5D8N4_ELECO|nr:hypothetical protein PR202_ga24268 [Eleusine coracana subsp. coracana]